MAHSKQEILQSSNGLAAQADMLQRRKRPHKDSAE
jgi:hypothetical protein